MPPQCKNTKDWRLTCKYYMSDYKWLGGRFNTYTIDACCHPRAVDVVGNSVSCWDMRSAGSPCGPEGVLYEQRPEDPGAGKIVLVKEKEPEPGLIKRALSKVGLVF